MYFHLPRFSFVLEEKVGKLKRWVKYKMREIKGENMDATRRKKEKVVFGREEDR